MAMAAEAERRQANPKAAAQAALPEESKAVEEASSKFPQAA